MFRQLTLAFAMIFAIATQLQAQDSPSPVQLNANGEFYGKAIAKDRSEELTLKAHVTLTLDGKTIHSVVSDETGLFSFSDVAPGVYTITATVDNYVSTETINIVAADPNAEASADPAVIEPAITLPLEPIASAAFANSSMYEMPMSSFAAAPSYSSGGGGGCSSCSGGYSSGGRGFGRLLPLVGLVGLAGLGGNASPNN